MANLNLLQSFIYKRTLTDSRHLFIKYKIPYFVCSTNLSTDVAMQSQTRTLTSTLLGPSVRKLLNEYDIKFVDVPTSGPFKILLKGDVLSYISDNKLKPKPRIMEKSEIQRSKPENIIETEFHIDIPLTSSQQTIAERLTSTKKNIPHAYMSVDCRLDNFENFKRQILSDGKEIYLNHLIIKCAAIALRQIPEMNVINANGNIRKMGSVNISLTSSDGIVVIPNADELTVDEIGQQIRSLPLLNSGSQTSNCAIRVSNLSEFGVVEYCEVVTPPEIAILAVGTDRFVIEDGVPKKKVKVTLSFDNKALTDSEAGHFMNLFRQYIENPIHILCMA